MPRSPKSAKAAGTKFERDVADYLNANWDDHIDRRVKTGAKDKGDIANFRTTGNEKIVAECKNTSRLALPAWWREVEAEKHNDEADYGVIIHKRHGSADPAKQWVTLPLSEFLKLLK